MTLEVHKMNLDVNNQWCLFKTQTDSKIVAIPFLKSIHKKSQEPDMKSLISRLRREC